jgi:hypothetical protein
MFDVILASLIVQKAPMIISSFVPLDPMLAKVAGIGAGYLTGMAMKKPDLANASIALGVIDFLNPFLDQLLGGVTTMLPEKIEPVKGVLVKQGRINKYQAKTVDDFISLNDYTNDAASTQVYESYRNSY